MKFNWNGLALAMLAAASLWVQGCGGFQGEHSVSPAMFLLRTTPSRAGCLEARAPSAQPAAQPALASIR